MPDIDDFAGTGALIGWSGDTASYDRSGGAGRMPNNSQFKMIIRTLARSTVNHEIRFDAVNAANTDHYHEICVRVQNTSATTGTTSHYVLYWTEAGAYGVNRVISGSSAADFVSGSNAAFANSIIQGILRVTTHPTSGNPVLNAWIGGTQILNNYEDTNAAKITTGLCVARIDYQFTTFDNFWTDDVSSVAYTVNNKMLVAHS